MVTFIFLTAVKELHDKLRGQKKPWLMNHSSVGKHTKVMNQIDMDNGGIKLYITTSVMLCGIDLPRVDIVVISRPFSHISSILHAAGKIFVTKYDLLSCVPGRGGRIMVGDTRRKVVVYLLYNRHNIRSNARHITKEVRHLYLDDNRVKYLLFKHFSNGSDEFDTNTEWCCDSHS